jgi:hypothetical protein
VAQNAAVELKGREETKEINGINEIASSGSLTCLLPRARHRFAAAAAADDDDAAR